MRERPDFKPEFLRPGQTLVGTPNVLMFGSDVPLWLKPTSITLINV
jgi:hypothetical protein